MHSEPVCAQRHDCCDTPAVTHVKGDLLEARFLGGDVKATFSGHDHENDYSITVEGNAMTYDGSAGYTAYKNGERVAASRM